jgi:putative endonuclease
MVRCADGTLYTGYAREPRERETVHNSGRGARYTSGRRPVRLVYWEGFNSVNDALRREYQLKRLTRAQKELLVMSGSTRAPLAVEDGRLRHRRPGHAPGIRKSKKARN